MHLSAVPLVEQQAHDPLAGEVVVKVVQEALAIQHQLVLGLTGCHLPAEIEARLGGQRTGLKRTPGEGLATEQHETQQKAHPLSLGPYRRLARAGQICPPATNWGLSSILFPMKFMLHVFLLVLAACSTMPSKVDPQREHFTDNGFAYGFPMAGTWSLAEYSEGLHVVGRAASDDGSTELASVKHGPYPSRTKKPTSRQELEEFKKLIQLESKGRPVKNTFGFKKHANAECLTYQQSGKNAPGDPLATLNEGMVCLHPTRERQYIWVTLSLRHPPKARVSKEFAEDKKRLFDTVRFFDQP